MFFRNALVATPNAAAITLLIVPVAGGQCAADKSEAPPTLSPFTEVRYEVDRVVVRVRGQLYELVALDGIPAAKILQSTRDQFGNRWQKRFAEDLVAVLWGMGHRPGATVKLELRNLKSGKLETVADAEMTEANRRAVWKSRDADSDSRPLRAERAQAKALVEEFAKILRDRWSYYPISASEVDAAIAELLQRLPESIGTDALSLELQKIIAHGIDGHAEVAGWQLEGDGFLPLLVEPCGNRYVAFLPDRSKLIEPDFPFIESIDRRRLDEWCDTAASVVPKGSPGYVQRHALRQLRNIQHWRKDLGLPQKKSIEIMLTSRDGQKHKDVTLALANQPGTYGVWPEKSSRLLERNVGYLRIALMDDDATQDIKNMMDRFRDSEGLVVDVRDNGGGSREPLRVLYSYLVGVNDGPRVINCAKYRLHRDVPDDHLEARFMYRANSDEWNDSERDAIAQFQNTIEPQWKPPEELFSEWHYMVLSRLDEPANYHYSKPVVVLMNAKCFSATDVFLAGLKGVPNVTLLGTTSGGGSARAETFPLGNTAITLRLGTMVSFMRDGRLFDGNGVEPDVVVDPAPEYFIGESDNVLDRAVSLIRAESN